MARLRGWDDPCACSAEDDGRRELLCDDEYTCGVCGDKGGDCKCGDDTARFVKKGEDESPAGGSGEYGGGLPRSRSRRLWPPLGGGTMDELELALAFIPASACMLEVYDLARPVRRRVCDAEESEPARERVRGGVVGGGRTGGGAACLGESDEVDERGEGELEVSGGTRGVSTESLAAEELCEWVSMVAVQPQDTSQVEGRTRETGRV
jgi:hypothetical protein